MADINSKFEIGVTTGPIRGSQKIHVGPLKGGDAADHWSLAAAKRRSMSMTPPAPIPTLTR